MNVQGVLQSLCQFLTKNKEQTKFKVHNMNTYINCVCVCVCVVYMCVYAQDSIRR